MAQKNKEEIKEKVHSDFEKFKEDSSYFEEFYKNNYNLVFRISLSILKNENDAEDVAQNVFEKIYRLDKEKLPKEYEASWLYTVTKNEALQLIRKNNAHINVSLEESGENIPQEKDEIEDSESKVRYEEILENLEQKEKQIVDLKVYSKFTFEEIGEILVMPAATVGWYYYKSMKSLKTVVGNIAMCIIAFLVGLVTSEKKENVFLDDGETVFEESACDMYYSATNKGEVENDKEITYNPIGTATLASMSYTEVSDLINVSNIFFCISTICLIIAVILVIKNKIDETQKSIKSSKKNNKTEKK